MSKSESGGGAVDRCVTGWIAKTARAQLWRVAGHMDLDDLLQDGLELYLICQKRRKPNFNEREFMEYFKTAYRNHITDLSNKRSAVPEVRASELVTDEDGDEWNWEDALGGVPAEALTLSIINSAPLLIRRVIELFTTDEGREKLAEKAPARESLNQTLCRILGQDAGRIDLVGMTRTYLVS